MKKNKLAVLTSCLILSGTFCTQAQNKTPQEIRIPDTYKLTNKSIYRKGWIDFNKNGKKDVYEDPTVPIDARVEDLLSQMNVEEKTCQMVTLYGYKRVLKDDLPTSDWKKQLWKDGIGAIDEHLNGFQQWGLPPSDNPYVWPASRHAWALNEVQRFFIEETRLGIPTDFTNEGIRLSLIHIFNFDFFHSFFAKNPALLDGFQSMFNSIWIYVAGVIFIAGKTCIRDSF